MSDQQPVVVVVKDLYKSFKLPHEQHSGIKQIILNFAKRKKGYEVQQVLEDVSFEIKKGEFFGIVGRNGSGKSTLLKLLAGIYAPDKGLVQVNGSLTPFIELGVGFNPELTGRENVFMNGALLGFSKSEMEAMYEDIMEFAELEKFMDQKLKNYSSGMQVRLAFSIAIRAQSDILLLDEVLAVGDEAFQRKCYEYFEELKQNRKTVILVTHDMGAVEKFCSRAMLIDGGKIIQTGNPRVVAQKYKDLNAPKDAGQKAPINTTGKDNEKLPHPKYLETSIIEGVGRGIFTTGDQLTVEVSWKKYVPRKFESIGVNIFKLSGEHVTGINSRTADLPKEWKNSGKFRLSFELNLGPGKYYTEIHMFEREGVVTDSIFDGPRFIVKSDKPTWSGLTELNHWWSEG